MEEEVDREMEIFEELWEEQHRRCSVTVSQLQDQLTAKGVDIVAFYKVRADVDEGGKGGDGGGKGNGSDGEDDEGEDGDLPEDWRKAADEELDKKDAERGFSKGEFQGASGTYIICVVCSNMLPMCSHCVPLVLPCRYMLFMVCLVGFILCVYGVSFVLL